ncbi:TRAP transporter small permease [Tropicibacter naphthalenivorans]|uniref:TRAP transporter small permease protein n=1 Tax=Tropicibacter naphthalenivorans TaxID=441103 RepID=A0A0P1GGW6_9RHOB|nr:TRAP transporter small permease [Tropicibacter naphthalenivorans]CUH80747.1 TRAP-type C4-dicarboxylate transport system, small permease component [Tropicibacter naphthalenivorans]SMC89938.1 TRAP-type C4-dicarboxylate transport system, small permease component [Tropicibacter naphthalenivorans]
MSEHRPARRPVRSAVVFIERVAAIILGLVTLLIVASAIGRYGFARPLPDAFDLSRLILGVAIAWGMASVAWHGTHIKVDLLAQMVHHQARRVINAIAWLVLLGFTAALVWKIGQRVDAAMGGGDATMDLRLPLWPFFLAIWLGLVAALFTTALRLWRIVRHGTDLGEFDGIDEQLLEEQKK